MKKSESLRFTWPSTTVPLWRDSLTSVVGTTHGSFQNHLPPAEPPEARQNCGKRAVPFLPQDVKNTEQLPSEEPDNH